MMLVLIYVHSLARRMGSAHILTLGHLTLGLPTKTCSITVNKKVQLDATVCRHLFTAKSLTFRDFAVNKCLHTVASSWTFLLTLIHDARNHELKKKCSITLRWQYLMVVLVFLSSKFQSSTTPTRYLILVPNG